MTLYTPELTNEIILKNVENQWRKFCLDTSIWSSETKIIHKLKFNWQEVKFKKENIDKIPESKGIYLFVVKPIKLQYSNDNQTYIMYVGSTKNLKNRFLNYFQYKNCTEPSDQLKRIMVLIWENYLYFNYQNVDVTEKKLIDIEFDLIDTLIPPMNNRFRAKIIKQSVKLYSPR